MEKLKNSPDNESAIDRVERMRHLSGIRLIVFDVDDTLVHARDNSFYSQYGMAVERALADYFCLDPEQVKNVAAHYRALYGGAEQALFRADLADTLGYHDTPHSPNYQILHDRLAALDPTSSFYKQEETAALIRALRSEDIRIIALTSSPTTLSRKILHESGYSLQDFDVIIGYEPDAMPPKMISDGDIFHRIADAFGVPMQQMLAVGDKPRYDVLPAVAEGALGCYVGSDSVQDASTYYMYPALTDLLHDIITARRKTDEAQT